MQTLMAFIHFILHIDSYLVSFVATYGVWTYAVLFAIIFCETGLVVTPFLPGDSLLFAAGSIAAHPESGLNIQLLFVLLLLASILGNKTNYLIGRTLGTKLFAKDRWFLNKKHLESTHAFYEKHGGKAIIFGRFLPIIRTFVPFVAGIGYMDLRLFSLYNIASALLWIGSLLGAGYFLGTIPVVQQNFTIVIYSIIIISLLPPFVAVLRHKFKT
jgi:membrane-associated protein